MAAVVFLPECINFNGQLLAKTTIEIDSIDNVAMQNSPHLRFKNVPIDGTLEKFVDRMVREGFIRARSFTTSETILLGDFADFKMCQVHVKTLTGKDLVSEITVHFPDKDKWEHLYGDYKHLKELLTIKYGKPSSHKEKFQSYTFDDNDRMHDVRMDRCKYKACFITDKGEIVLSIENGGYVMLSYKDKINGSMIKKYALEDL